MKPIRTVLATCLLLLAGCASVSKPVFPSQYALTVTAPPAAAAQLPSAGRGVLQVARIDAPPWLQGTALYYRLAYRQDGSMGAYARSEWLAPPARMLEPLVRETLARDRIWRVVVGPATGTNADTSLHIRLDDFSQVFASPDTSQGVLDATATLVDNSNGDAIAQRHFHVEVAAPSADATGGVGALDQASRQFIAQLQQWVRGAARPSDAQPSVRRWR
ncbi:MAG TPA: ABC-type transport auxiliary lipoprotein family protein [Rhodanobacteraceae bacterium]|nr:ABC-type transport auxiliary lipoprotein family protein [Rhodanobacteraceae bacterium]